jgi:hypothetical protein
MQPDSTPNRRRRATGSPGSCAPQPPSPRRVPPLRPDHLFSKPDDVRVRSGKQRSKTFRIKKARSRT